MTYDPNTDRTYWRHCEDKHLIVAARDSNHELAIALGERLEDYVAEMESREPHDARWGRSEDEYRATISVMRAEIKALEAQVADLLYKGD